MSTFEFNDQIKFVLPFGFLLLREDSEDGEEVVKVVSDEYETDEGETGYRFSCNLTIDDYAGGEDETLMSENLLESVAARLENARKLRLFGTPETLLLNVPMPIKIFGRTIKMHAVIALVQIGDWQILRLTVAVTNSDDDSDKNVLVYENLCKMLEGLRLDGVASSLTPLDASALEEALRIDFDNSGEAIDASPTIRFSIGEEGNATTYEYTSEGLKKVESEQIEELDSNVISLGDILDDGDQETSSDKTFSNKNAEPAHVAKQTSASSKRSRPEKPADAVQLTKRHFVWDGTRIKTYLGKPTNVILPEKMTIVGEHSFFYKTSVTSVIVPEGYVSLENGAFWSCSSMTNIFLPSTLREIGDKAFASCALTSVEIPDGCTKIGEECFLLCQSLAHIYVPASVTEIGKDAFDTCAPNTVIHTPAGSKADQYARKNGLTVENV